MSTRNLPGGQRRSALKADNLTAICKPIVQNSGIQPGVGIPPGYAITSYGVCKTENKLLLLLYGCFVRTLGFVFHPKRTTCVGDCVFWSDHQNRCLFIPHHPDRLCRPSSGCDFSGGGGVNCEAVNQTTD
jgi:hypothetical protein